MVNTRNTLKSAGLWIAQFALLTLTCVSCGGPGGNGSDAPTVNPTGNISLLAGSIGGPGNVDGVGVVARFDSPNGTAVDGEGNIFVVDSGNYTIRKISSAGVVTTLAGAPGVAGSADGVGAAARFTSPTGLAADAGGNLYVGDNNAIRKISPTGVVTTLAGTAGDPGSADGPGAAAHFYNIAGVAVDGGGNVYVVDSNILRKVSPSGVVTTLPGVSGVYGSAASSALLEGVAADGAGNVYVADNANHTVLKISSAGVVTILAGTAGVVGSADGAGAAASFFYPVGVAVDGGDNVYVGDGGAIRKISPAGGVTTLAGTVGVYGSVDGTGAAASFHTAISMAADGAGNIIVADTYTNTVRKVTPTGVVTTLAGSAGTGTASPTDGIGAAASFYSPVGVAVGGGNNVYVADLGSTSIRKISPAGVVTGAGLFDSGGGYADRYISTDVAVDGAGNVYGAFVGPATNDLIISKITSTGTVNTQVPGLNPPCGHFFSCQRRIAVDGGDNIYVVDSMLNTIFKITSAGVVTTLAGTAGRTGSTDGIGAVATFSYPNGVAVDGAGNLYVADAGNNTIRKITSTGVVTTFAGTAGAIGSADGVGAAASFRSPSGVAVDGAGNVYVADTYNDAIRKITPAGVVTTVAGKAGSRGIVLGSLPGSLSRPRGLAIDGDGVLYVTSEGAVLKIQL